MYIEGLSNWIVHKNEDLKKLIEIGNKNRKIRCTIRGSNW